MSLLVYLLLPDETLYFDGSFKKDSKHILHLLISNIYRRFYYGKRLSSTMRVWLKKKFDGNNPFKDSLMRHIYQRT